MRFRDDVIIEKYMTELINKIKSNKKLFDLFQQVVCDTDLMMHSIQVAKLGCAVAIEYNLNDEQIKNIAFGGFFHDVGKLEIPKDILYRKGKLNEREYKLVQEHPIAGVNLLKKIYRLDREVEKIIKYHHERPDGTGYLGVSELSLPVQIIHVADIFAAITENRSYHQALCVKDTVNKIQQFPDVDNNILDILKEIVFD